MFAWLEARAHCHATEDEDKVARSIKFLCPQIDVALAKTEGYYRNPILVLTARTDRQRLIREFWRSLESHGLTEGILSTGRKMIDEEWIMHLRFGKQEAFGGRAVLVNQEDAVSVRLKIARQPPRNRDALEVARQSIEELTEEHVSHT